MHSLSTHAYHYTHERLDVDQDGRRLREPESMNTSRIWTCMNQRVLWLTLQIVNAARPQELRASMGSRFSRPHAMIPRDWQSLLATPDISLMIVV